MADQRIILCSLLSLGEKTSYISSMPYHIRYTIGSCMEHINHVKLKYVTGTRQCDYFQFILPVEDVSLVYFCFFNIKQNASTLRQPFIFDCIDKSNWKHWERTEVSSLSLESTIQRLQHSSTFQPWLRKMTLE
jgi:hypothetical protein